MKSNKEKSKIYWSATIPLIILYAVVSVGTFVYVLLSIISSASNDVLKLIASLICLGVFCVSTFFAFFMSTREFLINFIFICKRKKLLAQHKKILETTLPEIPKVVLLYCIYNEFCVEAITTSMKQNYSNYELVILDDSNKPEVKKIVDEFAAKNNVRVIRRDNRQGFKAGALNNYLKNHQEEYDYIVVLDSDEKLPQNYIENSLKYFYNNKNLAALQSAHTAYKPQNLFQYFEGMFVKTDTLITMPSKLEFGFALLMGHGMMVSKKALVDVDFFPELIVEDFALTLKLLEKGYQVEYSPLIVCEEEYPPNYIIDKKRRLRWIEGEIEAQNKMKDCYKSKNLPAYLRFDFQITQFGNYKLPFFAVLFAVSNLVLAILGTNIFVLMPYFAILLALNTIFPFIKDLPLYLFTKECWKLPFYWILNTLIFVSYQPYMIFRVIRVWLGKKPFFNVTQKGKQKVIWLALLKEMIVPVVFIGMVAVLTYFAFSTIIPAMTFIATAVALPFIILCANIEINKKSKKVKMCGDNIIVFKPKHKNEASSKKIQEEITVNDV